VSAVDAEDVLLLIDLALKVALVMIRMTVQFKSMALAGPVLKGLIILSGYARHGFAHQILICGGKLKSKESWIDRNTLHSLEPSSILSSSRMVFGTSRLPLLPLFPFGFSRSPNPPLSAPASIDQPLFR